MHCLKTFAQVQFHVFLFCSFVYIYDQKLRGASHYIVVKREVHV